MRNETKEILDGICKMRRTQSPDSYTYPLDDKKVLHVFENPKTSQLSFLVNNTTNGDQYFFKHLSRKLLRLDPRIPDLEVSG